MRKPLPAAHHEDESIARNVTVDSAPVDVLIQDRLDVDDRRAVERLEMIDVHAQIVDTNHSQSMQANGVGPMRRAGAEHALWRARDVAARMDNEDIATRTVEPGKDDQLIACPHVSNPVAHVLVENEPG
jgi:hypothetical protein